MAKNTDPKLLTEIDLEEEPDERLRVHISYQIIKLFSEGLYRSPHKAVEELVSNSYDAGASQVHIVMNSDNPADSLWVVDDGTGMDRVGFERLWTIAKSEKAKADDNSERPPIGQFGIGKLAAYVLAKHLTHLSKTPAGYFFTSMDFSRVSEKDIEETEPLSLNLHKIDEDLARRILTELRERAPDIFERLFGPSGWQTWTIAAMSGFKSLGKKLKEGTLKWVLRTGLPVTGDFRIFVNSDRLFSAKLRKQQILAKLVVGVDDQRAEALHLKAHGRSGVDIPKLGPVTGVARIFKKPLVGGKSEEQYHRSHGFFVRVRKRVINLEDELFGLPAQNHAAWSRFYMEVEANGLRDFLLSSREGVRASDAVETLRKYLHKTFLACRQRYEEWLEKDLKHLDIQQLLENSPTLLVSEPLSSAVDAAVRSKTDTYRHIRVPRNIDDVDSWASNFMAEASERPFKDVELVKSGPYSDIAEYDAATQTLSVNSEHPFVTRIRGYSKSEHPAKLLSSAEVVGEALLHAVGVDPVLAHEYLDKRDKVLRLLAGEYPAAAPDALRYLAVANENKTALERAIGTAFEVLGFEYEKRGGNQSGTDGVLTAKLGRGAGGIRTYRIVFDAKTTIKAAVKLDKLRWEALNRFVEDEDADFAFILGKGFTDEESSKGDANREARSAGKTLLKIADLARLVELHMRYGVTLEELRGLFESCTDVPSVQQWLLEYERYLRSPDNHVPLLDLLEALEEQKDDEGAVPTVYVARRERPSLRRFSADRLVAMLQGVQNIISERWIEVDDQRGTVRLHQTPARLVEETNRVVSLTLLHEEK